MILISAILLISTIYIVYAQSSYINLFNDTIDEYMGMDTSLSSPVRRSLSPLVFKRVKDKPVEYAYSYRLVSHERRTLLITVPRGSDVQLNGVLLTKILEETNKKITFVGFIEASDNPAVLIVTSLNGNKPDIHISTEINPIC